MESKLQEFMEEGMEYSESGEVGKQSEIDENTQAFWEEMKNSKKQVLKGVSKYLQMDSFTSLHFWARISENSKKEIKVLGYLTISNEFWLSFVYFLPWRDDLRLYLSFRCRLSKESREILWLSG